MVVSVVGAVVASVVEIAAVFEEGLIEAHEADLAVATAALAAPPTATGAHPTHRVDLATVEVVTAADLTVTAGTLEAAAVAVTAVVTTTDSAVAAAVVVVAVDIAAPIDPDPAATPNRLAPDTVEVAAAAAAVGIATETTTDETTPGSALMRAVQDMKESGNFVGIKCIKTRPGLVLWWVYRVISRLSSSFYSPFRQQG